MKKFIGRVAKYKKFEDNFKACKYESPGFVRLKDKCNPYFENSVTPDTVRTWSDILNNTPCLLRSNYHRLIFKFLDYLLKGEDLKYDDEISESVLNYEDRLIILNSFIEVMPKGLLFECLTRNLKIPKIRTYEDLTIHQLSENLFNEILYRFPKSKLKSIEKIVVNTKLNSGLVLTYSG